jgi:hypothetical protein
MNKPAIAALLLATASALLAAGWWLGQQQTPAALDPSGGPERGRVATDLDRAEDLDVDTGIAAPPALDPSAAGSSAPTGPAVASLPPLDLPIDAIFDELADRADRGDAKAACRLAVELQRCRMAGFMGRGTRRLENRATREEDEDRRESMINELARIENERERSETVCSGLSTEQLDQAFRFQQQAAQSLPELRSWAATQPALNFMNFVNELDAWQQYRNTALPWLEAAAMEGDLAALASLTRVHSQRDPRQMRFPPISEPDDERFLLYGSLLERRGISFGPLQQGLDRVRNELDPAVLARVQQQTDTLASRLPQTPAPQGPALRQALGAGTPDPSRCE